ncbi:MAG TPA: hypothetical protein VF943_02100 [Burkholderiales bacterium]
MLKTAFWRRAANSLPAPIRARHLRHLEGAERFELFLDAMIDGGKRFTRVFQVLHPRAR